MQSPLILKEWMEELNIAKHSKLLLNYKDFIYSKNHIFEKEILIFLNFVSKLT